MSVMLLAALGFSRGQKIPFHLPASASLLRIMDVFTTGSVMWHHLCQSLSLVSLLLDKKVEVNSDTFLQGLQVVESTWC